MELKNKEIKKLFDYVAPYFDLFSLPSAMTEFMACDAAIEDEIAAIKARLTLVEGSRIIWNARAKHAEKEVGDLNKKIHELEQETADDTIRIKSLERANSVLRSDNGILWSKLEEADIPKYHKHPWHGDGNAMTGGRTCCESLTEAIEFQNKKIEEIEAEKARLKEAVDIQEATIKRLKLLLGKEHKENEVPTGDHEFQFGDKVFVPWSDGPYMYVKSGMMYNPRTESLVYVGKTQHLKWLGEKFEIK